MIAHLLLASTLLRDTQHDVVIVEIVFKRQVVLPLITVSILLRLRHIRHLLVNDCCVREVHRRTGIRLKARDRIIVRAVNGSRIERRQSVGISHRHRHLFAGSSISLSHHLGITRLTGIGRQNLHHLDGSCVRCCHHQRLGGCQNPGMHRINGVYWRHTVHHVLVGLLIIHLSMTG